MNLLMSKYPARPYHVSVKNPKLGFRSRLTERTSSILGASDMVLTSRALRPNTEFSFPWCDGIVVAKRERFGPRTPGVRWGPEGRSRRRFRGLITGMEPLFIPTRCKVSNWIFNVEDGEVCKLLSALRFSFSTGKSPKMLPWLRKGCKSVYKWYQLSVIRPSLYIQCDPFKRPPSGLWKLAAQ